jgi:GNAT superfamily N-acetyltransferase
MENNFENKENISVTSQTVSRDEMKNIVYCGEHRIADKRFFEMKKGGVFEYFPGELFNTSSLRGERELYYPIVKEGNKIIGVGELEKNPYEEGVFWIKFLSVDPEYQGKGYGRKLTEEVFRFAKERGIKLEASSYSRDGWAKLKPLQNKLAKETGVDFQDTDRTTFFDREEKT